MERIVSKFGGSSVLQFNTIAQIVANNENRRWIVVSAPGDADKRYRVTQMLIRLADYSVNKDPGPESAQELRNRIVGKYTGIFGSSVQHDVERSLDERIARNELRWDEYLANMKAFGEYMTAKLAADALGFTFTDLRDIMVVDGEFDAAKVRPESYDLMQEALHEGRFVIPGFFGYDCKGKVRTFAFGGSDKTGAEIARGVGATLYENFTDSPIRAADPKYVSDAIVIAEMTLSELRDLSYAGFGIYHSEAIEPLIEPRIPLHVLSTKNWNQAGTMVFMERLYEREKPIVGVAYREGLCALGVSRVGLNDMHGVLARTAQVLQEEEIAIEFPATGIDDVSFVVSQQRLDGARLNRILSRFSELTKHGQTSVYDNLGCVVVAGKGIEYDALRISAKASLALADADINVVADTMGLERRCIMYAIPITQGARAVQALYNAFIREGEP